MAKSRGRRIYPSSEVPKPSMGSSVPEPPISSSYREPTGRIPTLSNFPPSAKPKIDPNQIPSPVNLQALDEQHYARRDYSTMSREIPPLATTNFTAIDYGNCNPRYMRSTLYNIPMSEEMLNMTRIPFGILSQPLANIKDTEVDESHELIGGRYPICWTVRILMGFSILFPSSIASR